MTDKRDPGEIFIISMALWTALAIVGVIAAAVYSKTLDHTERMYELEHCIGVEVVDD